jgi:predicted nucleic acid-binding protein
MILCDMGPLVALIGQDDSFHTRCVAALSTLPAEPLLTTWPCLVEAMYLLWRASGSPAQEELWGYLADELVVLHAPEAGEWERMRTLMRQYHDAPMDLADASLVVAAERLNLRRIFTLDSHFRAYRIDETHLFDIVPLR